MATGLVPAREAFVSHAWKSQTQSMQLMLQLQQMRLMQASLSRRGVPSHGLDDERHKRLYEAEVRVGQQLDELERRMGTSSTAGRYPPPSGRAGARGPSPAAASRLAPPDQRRKPGREAQVAFGGAPKVDWSRLDDSFNSDETGSASGEEEEVTTKQVHVVQDALRALKAQTTAAAAAESAARLRLEAAAATERSAWAREREGTAAASERYLSAFEMAATADAETLQEHLEKAKRELEEAEEKEKGQRLDVARLERERLSAKRALEAHEGELERLELQASRAKEDLDEERQLTQLYRAEGKRSAETQRAEAQKLGAQLRESIGQLDAVRSSQAQRDMDAELRFESRRRDAELALESKRLEANYLETRLAAATKEATQELEAERELGEQRLGAYRREVESAMHAARTEIMRLEAQVKIQKQESIRGLEAQREVDSQRMQTYQTQAEQALLAQKSEARLLEAQLTAAEKQAKTNFEAQQKKYEAETQQLQDRHVEAQQALETQKLDFQRGLAEQALQVLHLDAQRSEAEQACEIQRVEVQRLAGRLMDTQRDLADHTNDNERHAQEIDQLCRDARSAFNVKAKEAKDMARELGETRAEFADLRQSDVHREADYLRSAEAHKIEAQQALEIQRLEAEFSFEAQRQLIQRLDSQLENAQRGFEEQRGKNAARALEVDQLTSLVRGQMEEARQERKNVKDLGHQQITSSQRALQAKAEEVQRAAEGHRDEIERMEATESVYFEAQRRETQQRKAAEQALEAQQLYVQRLEAQLVAIKREAVQGLEAQREIDAQRIETYRLQAQQTREARESEVEQLEAKLSEAEQAFEKKRVAIESAQQSAARRGDVEAQRIETGRREAAEHALQAQQLHVQRVEVQLVAVRREALQSLEAQQELDAQRLETYRLQVQQEREAWASNVQQLEAKLVEADKSLEAHQVALATAKQNATRDLASEAQCQETKRIEIAEQALQAQQLHIQRLETQLVAVELEAVHGLDVQRELDAERFEIVQMQAQQDREARVAEVQRLENKLSEAEKILKEQEVAFATAYQKVANSVGSEAQRVETQRRKTAEQALEAQQLHVQRLEGQLVAIKREAVQGIEAQRELDEQRLETFRLRAERTRASEVQRLEAKLVEAEDSLQAQQATFATVQQNATKSKALDSNAHRFECQRREAAEQALQAQQLHAQRVEAQLAAVKREALRGLEAQRELDAQRFDSYRAQAQQVLEARASEVQRLEVKLVEVEKTFETQQAAMATAQQHASKSLDSESQLVAQRQEAAKQASEAKHALEAQQLHVQRLEAQLAAIKREAVHGIEAQRELDAQRLQTFRLQAQHEREARISHALRLEDKLASAEQELEKQQADITTAQQGAAKNKNPDSHRIGPQRRQAAEQALEAQQLHVHRLEAELAAVKREATEGLEAQRQLDAQRLQTFCVQAEQAMQAHQIELENVHQLASQKMESEARRLETQCRDIAEQAVDAQQLQLQRLESQVVAVKREAREGLEAQRELDAQRLEKCSLRAEQARASEVQELEKKLFEAEQALEEQRFLCVSAQENAARDSAAKQALEAQQLHVQRLEAQLAAVERDAIQGIEIQRELDKQLLEIYRLQAEHALEAQQVAVAIAQEDSAVNLDSEAQRIESKRREEAKHALEDQQLHVQRSEAQLVAVKREAAHGLEAQRELDSQRLETFRLHAERTLEAERIAEDAATGLDPDAQLRVQRLQAELVAVKREAMHGLEAQRELDAQRLETFRLQAEQAVEAIQAAENVAKGLDPDAQRLEFQRREITEQAFEVNQLHVQRLEAQMLAVKREAIAGLEAQRELDAQRLEIVRIHAEQAEERASVVQRLEMQLSRTRQDAAKAAEDHLNAANMWHLEAQKLSWKSEPSSNNKMRQRPDARRNAAKRSSDSSVDARASRFFGALSSERPAREGMLHSSAHASGSDIRGCREARFFRDLAAPSETSSEASVGSRTSSDANGAARREPAQPTTGSDSASEPRAMNVGHRPAVAWVIEMGGGSHSRSRQPSQGQCGSRSRLP